MQILSPEEVVAAHLARWVIYAENGRGKTSFLASIAKAQLRVLVVSFDQENTRPLLGLSPWIKVVKVYKWAQILQVFELFRQRTTMGDMNFTPRPEYVNAPPGRKPFFDVLAFDTYTRAQGLAANQIIGYDPFAPGQDFKKWINEAPKNPKGWEQWQQIGSLAAEWERYFMMLPVHVIFLMQEMEYETRFKSGVYRRGPALTPSALIRTKEMCHLLGRLYTTTEGGSLNMGDAGGGSKYDINPQAVEKRYLLLGGHDYFDTKGPTHVLGYTVEDPTWETLAKSLTVGMQPIEAPAQATALDGVV